MIRVLLALALLALAAPASAQSTTRPTAIVVTTCGTAPSSAWATVGGIQPIVQDVNGNLCMGGAGGGGSVATSPAARTIVTLAVKTVTTGGTAVNAMAAGDRTAGGLLTNPKAATIDLCINEIGAATGTLSSGDTTCILPGQSYNVVPAAGAVSVVTSDSAHPFSGYGLR